jgi:hypothetical protein
MFLFNKREGPFNHSNMLNNYFPNKVNYMIALSIIWRKSEMLVADEDKNISDHCCNYCLGYKRIFVDANYLS